MNRILFVVAVLSSMALAATASAAPSRTAAGASATRQGPVAKLIELERRKNEWLRQRFLSR